MTASANLPLFPQPASLPRPVPPRPSTRRLSRLDLAIAALAAAGLAWYVVWWARISPVDTGRGDFTNTYVGALLLRRGLGAAMYLPAVQRPLYLHVIAPLRTAVLPFLDTPSAAAVALPFTFLTFRTAYRVWSLMQLLLIVASAIIAIRAAPRREASWRRDLAVALIAVSGFGSAITLILGQWDGVWALGVAVFYLLLRRHRMLGAGLTLAVTTLLAKPQLGLGLAAFVLGWRDRRLILGALIGGVALVASWLWMAGPPGVAGFFSALVHSIGVWQPSIMVSFVAIPGVLFRDTPATHLLGIAASLVFMGFCAFLGSAVRQRWRLEAGLAAVAVLSLLAAPHAFPQDVAMLTPVIAWSLSALGADHGRARLLWIAGVSLWAGLSLAVVMDVATAARPPLGVLTPWVLLAAAASSAAVCLAMGPETIAGGGRRGRSAPMGERLATKGAVG